MIQAHFYFIIRRNQANLNETNWAAVVDLVKQIAGVDGGHPEYLNHWRGNLDTFVLGDITYSNEYIFEARFAVNAVSFDAFKNKLVAAFGVDPALVTYTTGTQTVLNRLSVFATYKYNATNRMIVGLFGWADEDSPPTWNESRAEAAAYVFENTEEWE